MVPYFVAQAICGNGSLGGFDTSRQKLLQSNDPVPLLEEGLFLLGVLRYRNEHSDLCKLYFKVLVTKLGLKCSGPRKSLIESIDRRNLESSIDASGTNCQVWRIHTLRSLWTPDVPHKYKEDSKQTTTPTAWVSCNESGIKNMKIYDAMAKFVYLMRKSPG